MLTTRFTKGLHTRWCSETIQIEKWEWNLLRMLSVSPKPQTQEVSTAWLEDEELPGALISAGVSTADLPYLARELRQKVTF